MCHKLHKARECATGSREQLDKCSECGVAALSFASPWGSSCAAQIVPLTYPDMQS